MVVVIDLVQQRGEGAAGGGLRFEVLRPSTICSNRCGKQQGEASGKCAREREERDDRWEETRASHRVGIDGLRRQYYGAPARDFTGLVASLARGKEGNWRGGGGQFIGAECRRLRQAIKEIDEGSNQCGGSVTGERNGWRWVMTGGSHLSVRERERRGVPVRGR
jgi:hypothetical protein